SARSCGPSCPRAVSDFGLTVRNTGPRLESNTATTTFELLGVSNTTPSSAGPTPATDTSSPTVISSTNRAYPSRDPTTEGSGRGCGRVAIRQTPGSLHVVDDLAGSRPLLGWDH